MVRKIKIVNVDMTIKTDPIIEIQNENLKDVIEPEVIQPIEEALIIEEPVKVEEQIKSEDEVIIDTNTKPEKKPVATGTCDLCGKTMLLKNLKYAHPKVCKSKPPPPTIPPPPPPSVIIERVVVNTPNKTEVYESTPRVEPPKTIEQKYQEHKQNKTDIRKQRIQSLIQNAF